MTEIYIKISEDDTLSLMFQMSYEHTIVNNHIIFKDLFMNKYTKFQNSVGHLFLNY